MFNGINKCILTFFSINYVVRSSAGISDYCDRMVIAHRGASGYVPEHTLGAYALAVTMGADYVEPDLVSTKDGHLVARHDNELSISTDVAQHPEFASRRRTQAIDETELTGWFTEDFTLSELKTLRSTEFMPELRPGNARMNGSFTIPTFQEITSLIKTLQRNQKRTIGVYPELKHSTHFRNLGLSLEGPLLQTLWKNGYRGAKDPIYIQSLEVSNLKELCQKSNFRLVQLYDTKSLQPYDQKLLGSNVTYGSMSTKEGLKKVSAYANAVAPDKSYIIPRDAGNMLGAATSFVQDAHDVGLKVHPYVFQAENIFLPNEFRSEDADSALGDLSGEIKAFFDAGVDGIITDQPDKAVKVRGCW